MISRTITNSVVLVALMFGAAGFSMPVSGKADARRGVKPYYSETYEFD